MKQAVVLAGGRGKRLLPLTKTIPKPMVEVSGLPFLHRLIQQVADQGIEEVVILAGYLGEVIEDYLLSRAESGLPTRITVLRTPEAISPGQRILEAKEFLHSQFLLLYGDNYVLVSLENLSVMFHKLGAKVVLSAQKKTPGNLTRTKSGRVSNFSPTERSEALDLVELGYMFTERDALLHAIAQEGQDLSAGIHALVQENLVGAVLISHPYFSVSDPIRLEKTRRAFSGEKLLLLDRDGVINEKPPPGTYVSSVAHLRFITDSMNTIKTLSHEGFSFAILTNQAGLERGLVSSSDYSDINEAIFQEFRSIGADLRGIYTCPHHWETGCGCRKPKPGLFFEAVRELGFFLNRTIFVGDQRTDQDAAAAAGAKTILLDKDDSESIAPDTPVFRSLNGALPFIRAWYRGLASTT